MKLYLKLVQTLLFFFGRGSDWNLSNPDYTVRLRIVGEGSKCLIKMEDKISGEMSVMREALWGS